MNSGDLRDSGLSTSPKFNSFLPDFYEGCSLQLVIDLGIA